MIHNTHKHKQTNKPLKPKTQKARKFPFTKSSQEKEEMEEEGIEVVLAKAIDLRLKISNCIHKASAHNISKENRLEKKGLEGGGAGVTVTEGEEKKSPSSVSENGGQAEEEEEEEEEAERLFHIRDALESLEHQLSSLQDLQQQQRYEREVALSEIEQSRKVLLEKLKEYNGEDLEVIQEASAFAGERVESNSDLLLPPYPSRPPQSLVVDGQYLLHFPSARKSMRNGVITGEAKKNVNGSESNQVQTVSKNSRKGLGHVIGMAARTVITLVGVISVLSLSGFGPNIGKKGISLNIVGLFQQPGSEKQQKGECPPGRVLVMEDGEARCIVKERVAVPFELVATKPDVNYGSG